MLGPPAETPDKSQQVPDHGIEAESRTGRKTERIQPISVIIQNQNQTYTTFDQDREVSIYKTNKLLAEYR